MSEENPAVSEFPIVDRLPQCPTCRGPIFGKGRVMITVEAVISKEGKWDAVGKGRFRNQHFCPTCGAIVNAVVRFVPLSLTSLVCPNCQQSKGFDCTVRQIMRSEDHKEFDFEAELVCKSCKGKKSFKEMLKDILKITKIEIGPTGIRVGTK